MIIKEQSVGSYQLPLFLNYQNAKDFFYCNNINTDCWNSKTTAYKNMQLYTVPDSEDITASSFHIRANVESCNRVSTSA